MTAERKPSFRRKTKELRARLEAKKPTPNQTKNYIDMAGSDPIFNEGAIDIYPPTKHDIEQKKEEKKYGKRGDKK